MLPTDTAPNNEAAPHPDSTTMAPGGAAVFPSIAMYSADDLLDLKLQFDTQGFVHLPGVLGAGMTERVRDAFAAAHTRHAAEVERQRKEGASFVDLPRILDADSVFVDLVDLPQLLPLLRLTVGEDLALNDTNARLFFPGPTFTGPFHSDVAHVLGVDHAHTNNLLVKLHIFFEDLAPEQGCLAFIPGSHRFPPLHVNPHRPTLARSSAVTRVVPRAGDAVLFNTHVLHMAEDNLTERVRKSLIYTYAHFWMKARASAAPSDLAQFADSPCRQQLFGVDLPGVSHFSRRLDRLEDVTLKARVQDIGERIAHRILPLKKMPPRA
ncbi:phytanoyl-CoA dioxygenase family protein [Massilia sp.]|uniref:phytanoyl-CoA dioxygenase family protein n=1 Tax=Massilia sp. TaxID=1882437 RepID=UPI00391889FB